MNRPNNVAFALVVVLLVSSIAVAGSVTSLPADLDVEAADCADGTVDQLTLTVTYHGDEPRAVTPHVWSERQHVQFAWIPEQVWLEPGTQTVTITAPDARAVIDGERAQVYLVDGPQRVVENFDVQCGGVGQ